MAVLIDHSVILYIKSYQGTCPTTRIQDELRYYLNKFYKGKDIPELFWVNYDNEFELQLEKQCVKMYKVTGIREV